MSPHANLRQIERIELPDAARFFADYAWPNVPVLVAGVAQRWGSLDRWQPRRLAELIRDDPMPVSISEGVYDFNPHADNWLPRETIVQMPVRELVRRIETRTNERECLYLNQQSIPRRLPELMAHMSLPPLVPEDSIQDVFLWLGSQGNISSLHFDQPNNFFIQLHGIKRFKLYSPHDYANLYPSQTIGHFSRVNIDAPDLAAHPLLAQARGFEVTVNAGDMLYLPPFWWHQVYSDSTSVSVSVFWRAYTHQLAVPAFLRGLPALYPKLAAKYATYLPGRLPQLTDFAQHLLEAGEHRSALLVACAAIEARLREFAPDLGEDAPIDAVLAAAVDDGGIDEELQAQLRAWLAIGAECVAGTWEGDAATAGVCIEAIRGALAHALADAGQVIEI